MKDQILKAEVESDEKRIYDISQADQLVQCPECKEYIEICDSILVCGKEYCDDCVETVREEIRQIRERYPTCPVCLGTGNVLDVFGTFEARDCRNCSGEGVVELKS